MADRENKREYTETVCVRFRPEDIRRIKMAADLSGLKVSTWIRQAAVDRSQPRLPFNEPAHLTGKPRLRF